MNLEQAAAFIQSHQAFYLAAHRSPDGDCIVWKKGSALPNNVSKNKMTRITEFVFVFCRKDEFMTYNANKKIKRRRKDTGQIYYENTFNFIEAKNNDGACSLNKATYSTDLCVDVLEKYCTDGMKILDPFMGTGTTAVAVEKYAADNGLNLVCIGCELSEKQVEFSKNRLELFRTTGKTNFKEKDVKAIGGEADEEAETETEKEE